MTECTKDEDLGFTYQIRRNGDIEVLHHSHLAITLRGTAATDFLQKIQAGTSTQAQQFMARITGNYKHGNERTAGSHPRNRR